MSAAIGLALAATLAVDGLSLANGSSGTTHGAPVIRSAPTKPPATQRGHDVCAVKETTDAGSRPVHGLVWVRPDPTSVVTIWNPGLNSHACRARRVVAGTAAARRIATGIEHGRAVGGGSYACPNSDASHVELYLRYADGGDEYANVDLTGCDWISAPRRDARWIDSAVGETLRTLAPPAWRHYYG